MRKNFGAQSWLYPMPVLLVGTYDEAGKADLMQHGAAFMKPIRWCSA